MTLSFSKENISHPRYFVEKIYQALQNSSDPDFILKIKSGLFLSYGNQFVHNMYEFKDDKEYFKYIEWGGNLNPKLHTIREDKNNRWGAGCDIHFVINNRTPNRFQFAPVIKCKSVQDILMKHHPGEIPGTMFHFVYVDGYQLHDINIKKLAINDGFDSAEDFFSYFNKDFSGKIVHWTDLKY